MPGGRGRQGEQLRDDLGGPARLVPDQRGVVLVAAAGGQRLVLAVNEDGFDVPGADPHRLQHDDLALLVAVVQETTCPRPNGTGHAHAGTRRCSGWTVTSSAARNRHTPSSNRTGNVPRDHCCS